MDLEIVDGRVGQPVFQRRPIETAVHRLPDADVRADVQPVGHAIVLERVVLDVEQIGAAATRAAARLPRRAVEPPDVTEVARAAKAHEDGASRRVAHVHRQIGDQPRERQRAGGCVVDARERPRGGLVEPEDATVRRAHVQLRRRRERHREDAAGSSGERDAARGRPRRAEIRGDVDDGIAPAAGAVGDDARLRRRAGVVRRGHERRGHHHPLRPGWRDVRPRRPVERAVRGAIDAAVGGEEHAKRVVPVHRTVSAIAVQHVPPHLFTRVLRRAVVLQPDVGDSRLGGVLRDERDAERVEPCVARLESSGAGRIRVHEQTAVVARPQDVRIAGRVHEHVHIGMRVLPDGRGRDGIVHPGRRHVTTPDGSRKVAAIEVAAAEIDAVDVVGIDGDAQIVVALARKEGRW